MRWMSTFGSEVHRLSAASSTNEATYYPAIRTLLTDILSTNNLPFEVRTGTSEKRQGGGADQPDLAFYDRSGTMVVLYGEVKLPAQELRDMARSTERNDQIGRYLAGTRAVLALCQQRRGGFAIAQAKSLLVHVKRQGHGDLVPTWPCRWRQGSPGTYLIDGLTPACFRPAPGGVRPESGHRPLDGRGR